ncbi:MAG TPA: hypothetical protein VMU43_10020 [Candidatus Acidoferrum sp.]|nr:hypothetical protein [Candidatus Acidoferrum sp.]
MSRGSGRCVSCALVASLLVLGFSLPVPAQGLGSVIQPNGKLFPSVGPGVSTIKQDSQGRFYILAKPATHVSIYSADGRLLGEIPPTGSSAKIVFAMDFDLGADGSVLVADRGGNAVFAFRPDGSLAARIPVFAPTSVVALSNHQFAVASFHARRLVDIFNDRGELIRSFGDPADSAAPAPGDDSQTPKNPPMYLGRIFGDPDGQIFFAFTSMPDPTFRRYDRYGYVAYEASVPESDLVPPDYDRFDRLQFSFGFTRFDLSDQFVGSATLGSSGDLRFGGGVGAGLGAHLNREPGGGGGFGGPPGGGFGGLAGGGPTAGMLTAQGTLSANSFHVTVGGNPGVGGAGGRPGPNSATNSNSSATTSDAPGAILQFAGIGTSSGTRISSEDVNFAELESTDILNNSSSASSSPSTDSSAALSSPDDSALGSSVAIPGDFGLGGGFGGPLGGPSGFGEHFLYNRFFGGGFGGGSPGTFNRGATGGTAAPGEGSRTFAGGGSSEPFPRFGPHGHFGGGMTGFTGGVHINLDKPVHDPSEKPVFTALAVDPRTENVWAAIGDSLVVFDKSGSRLAVFTLVNDGNVPLRPSALLIEPDRLIVAVDPWGIFQFARPDTYLSSTVRAAGANPHAAPTPY